MIRVLAWAKSYWAMVAGVSAAMWIMIQPVGGWLYKVEQHVENEQVLTLEVAQKVFTTRREAELRDRTVRRELERLQTRLDILLAHELGEDWRNVLEQWVADEGPENETGE